VTATAPSHPDVRWYAITHITDYHYSAPVTSSYGRGHLFPRTTETQRCLDATVTVSPTPMAMRARWLPISGRPSDSVARTWGR